MSTTPPDPPKRGRSRAHSVDDIGRILALYTETRDAKAVCEAWGISEQTLKKYRERLTSTPPDPQIEQAFARHFRAAKRRIEEGEANAYAPDEMGQSLVEWHALRPVFLTEALQAMRERLPSAELRDIAHAVQVVGELDVTIKALSDGVTSNSEGAEPSRVPGKASVREESDSTRLPH